MMSHCQDADNSCSKQCCSMLCHAACLFKFALLYITMWTIKNLYNNNNLYLNMVGFKVQVELVGSCTNQI